MVDFVIEEGKWDWNKLSSCLPTICTMHIAALCPPKENAGEHYLSWIGAANGRFSVKNAYFVRREDDHGVEGIWKLIWKWPRPQRIRTFLWLVVQNKLLTNE